MGWLSAFFSFDNGSRAGKSQVFSSTHDAFSLPTSSPSIRRLHPDAFNPPTSPSTPTPFTYPPQGDYLKPSPRPAFPSLLPTHLDHVQTRTPYPPLSKTWVRIQNWLNKEYPELGDTLNYGILPQDLSDLELQLGLALPAVVRESYLCVDGQEAESSAGCSEGLFFGLKLLPLESVLEEWTFWREVDHDPLTGANPSLISSMQSIPPKWVRKEYSQRGWIPLIADKVGNYIGVDLSPAEEGQVGQVIVFGRDFDTKVVLWRGDGPTGWANWLAGFADELETGEGFEIGNNDDSSGSEDELGYGSYFYDGNGRGEGVSDLGSGGGLRLTGDYKGWNVLEAWADRSLRKWHQAGVITDADLVPLGESPTTQAAGDLNVVNSNGSSTEIHIPVLDRTEEHIASSSGLRSQSSQRSQSTIRPTGQHKTVPAISITKPPAPLPVALPTPHDIAPLPSPPESDDDLEAGRGHEAELSLTRDDDTENIGLVTSTRRKGKSKSPIRREGTDYTTESMLPLPPTPRSPDDLVTPTAASSPNLHSTLSHSSELRTSAVPDGSAANVPDLLMDATPSTMSGAPPLKPSLSSGHAKEDLKLEISTPSNLVNQEEVGPDTTTVRLIGGGGETGISQSPVEVHAEGEKESDPELSPPLDPETTHDGESNSSAKVAGSNKSKGHKKSKSSLANLKKFGVGAFGKKKDSASSVKEPPSR